MRIHGSALVAGGALVVAAWLSIGATPQLARHPAGRAASAAQATGAVDPRDIVNIDSTSLAPNGTVTMAAGSALTILTVPPDRWFVMTDWECSSYLGPFQLEEDAGAQVTVKRGCTWVGNSFASAVGLCFAPGSRIVLRSVGAAGEAGFAIFSLSGYLADAAPAG